MRSLHRRAAAVGASVALAALGGAAYLGSGQPAFSVASFRAPVVVDPGIDASEPGVDVAPDGTVYVNAPAGLLSNLPGSASYVWRSDNGGTSFVLTPAGARANLPGGGDSDIAIDSAGRLFMTDLWLGSATVSESDDKANTWTANPLQGVVVQDRQWVATTGGGTVYHVTHQIPTGLIVSKSVTGGATFLFHNVAATPLDQTGCVCPPGNLVAEAGGLLGDKVGVIYATSTGGVKFAHSENGGLTFTNTEVSPASAWDTSTNFPVVADAGSGKLVAVWTEELNGQSRIRYSTSSDFGASWRVPATLIGTGANVFPWVDARGSKVAVTLFHTSEAGTASTVPSSAQWFETYLESNDGGASFSSPIAIDPTPVKTGPICTEGINCSGDRELGDFQQVTVDSLGNTHAVWSRSNGNGTAVAVYTRQG